MGHSADFLGGLEGTLTRMISLHLNTMNEWTSQVETSAGVLSSILYLGAS